MSLHRYHIPRNSSTTPSGSAVSFCGIKQCYGHMLNQPKCLLSGLTVTFDSRCRFPIGSSADQRFMPWNLMRGLEKPGLGIRLFIPWALSNVRSSLWNICSLIHPRFALGVSPRAASRDGRTSELRENRAALEAVVHYAQGHCQISVFVLDSCLLPIGPYRRAAVAFPRTKPFTSNSSTSQATFAIGFHHTVRMIY
jgi:hypothetical protein